MKTVDFSETVAAGDLKVGRCRHFFTILYFFQVLYFLYLTRPRYQVSVYIQDHWSSGCFY